MEIVPQEKFDDLIDEIKARLTQLGQQYKNHVDLKNKILSEMNDRLATREKEDLEKELADKTTSRYKCCELSYQIRSRTQLVLTGVEMDRSFLDQHFDTAKEHVYTEKSTADEIRNEINKMLKDFDTDVSQISTEIRLLDSECKLVSELKEEQLRLVPYIQYTNENKLHLPESIMTGKFCIYKYQVKALKKLCIRHHNKQLCSERAVEVSLCVPFTRLPSHPAYVQDDGDINSNVFFGWYHFTAHLRSLPDVRERFVSFKHAVPMDFNTMQAIDEDLRNDEHLAYDLYGIRISLIDDDMTSLDSKDPVISVNTHRQPCASNDPEYEMHVKLIERF